MKTLRRLLCCLVGLHRWQYHQELFITYSGLEQETKVVIGWKQCKCCAKSKLDHILK